MENGLKNKLLRSIHISNNHVREGGLIGDYALKGWGGW